MKCPRCQSQNREGVRFCEECGARLVTTCPSCNAEAAGQALLRLLRLPDDPRAGGAPALPPGLYPEAPRREDPHRRPRSKASASRSRCCSPTSRARWSCWPTATRRRRAKLLDPVLERMMEAVHRYEGTVNQVMGDGIMALFGAPLAHEDHAVRACYAALRDAGARRRYAEELRRAHGVAMQIRVGLNSGEVVVRADRQRPAHGLHGGRPDDAPGRADGAARRRRARSCSTARRCALAEGYVAGQAARADAGQGPAEPGRGVRARRSRRRRAPDSRPPPRAA